MNGFAAEVERSLMAVRDLFGAPVLVDGPRSPVGAGEAGQPGWSGSAAQGQQRSATDLREHRDRFSGADSRLGLWASSVAADTAAGRQSASALVGSAQSTRAALAPFLGSVQGRLALVRALTDHLAAAGGLVNDHVSTLPGRQQQLAAAAAAYGLSGPAGPAPPVPVRPRRRPSHHRRRRPRGRGRGAMAPFPGMGGGGGRPMSGMSAGGALGSFGAAGFRPPRGSAGSGGGALASGAVFPGGVVGGGPATFGPLNADQMNVAKVFTAEAMKRGLPRPLAMRAAEMAIGCGLQESGLRILSNPNVPDSQRIPHNGEGHDHDSVGPLQQRQSWGRTADLMNPATSVNKFYDQLLRVPGWSTMRYTAAIQSVQRSGFPTAYAKHEALATSVVRAIMGGG